MAKKIESLMLEQGYTYEDLANTIGVSLQQIQRCEQGIDKTMLEMLYAVTEALSGSVTDLLPESMEYSEAVIGLVSWIRKCKRIQGPELRKVLLLLFKSILVGGSK